MKTLIKEILPGILTIGFVSTLAISLWLIRSHMEAKAYNRVTGSNVTTWDAMWIELRVQGGDKP